MPDLHQTVHLHSSLKRFKSNFTDFIRDMTFFSSSIYGDYRSKEKYWNQVKTLHLCQVIFTRIKRNLLISAWHLTPLDFGNLVQVQKFIKNIIMKANMNIFKYRSLHANKSCGHIHKQELMFSHRWLLTPAVWSTAVFMCDLTCVYVWVAEVEAVLLRRKCGTVDSQCHPSAEAKTNC